MGQQFENMNDMQNRRVKELLEKIAKEKASAAKPKQVTPEKAKQNYNPIGMGGAGGQAAPKGPNNQPIIPTDSFAYNPGEMDQVARLRQQALQGFSGGELGKRREGFQQPIETNRLAALRSLERGQVHSGVKGGSAYAQSQDVNRQAAQASANAGRDLTLANEQYKRQALGDLQGFLGKERYGQFASTLAGRQLGIQEGAANDQNAVNQQILEYLKSRNPEALAESGLDPARGGWLGQQGRHAANATKTPAGIAARGAANPTNVLSEAYDWLRG